MSGLNPRGRQVLGAIHDHLAETGSEPRSGDLRARLGLSANTAAAILKRLEAGGWIEPRAARQHRLRVRRMPGGGLTWAELQWCQRHADRVLALINVVGEAGS